MSLSATVKDEPNGLNEKPCKRPLELPPDNLPPVDPNLQTTVAQVDQLLKSGDPSVVTKIKSDDLLRRTILDELSHRPELWNRGMDPKKRNEAVLEIITQVHKRTKQVVSAEAVHSTLAYIKKSLNEKLKKSISKDKLDYKDTEELLRQWPLYRYAHHFRVLNHEKEAQMRKDMENEYFERNGHQIVYQVHEEKKPVKRRSRHNQKQIYEEPVILENNSIDGITEFIQQIVASLDLGMPAEAEDDSEKINDDFTEFSREMSHAETSKSRSQTPHHSGEPQAKRARAENESGASRVYRDEYTSYMRNVTKWADDTFANNKEEGAKLARLLSDIAKSVVTGRLGDLEKFVNDYQSKN